jgi:hypothetical protein
VEPALLLVGDSGVVEESGELVFGDRFHGGFWVDISPRAVMAAMDDVRTLEYEAVITSRKILRFLVRRTLQPNPDPRHRRWQGRRSLPYWEFQWRSRQRPADAVVTAARDLACRRAVRGIFDGDATLSSRSHWTTRRWRRGYKTS